MSLTLTKLIGEKVTVETKDLTLTGHVKDAKDGWLVIAKDESPWAESHEPTDWRVRFDAVTAFGIWPKPRPSLDEEDF